MEGFSTGPFRKILNVFGINWLISSQKIYKINFTSRLFKQVMMNIIAIIIAKLSVDETLPPIVVGDVGGGADKKSPLFTNIFA